MELEKIKQEPTEPTIEELHDFYTYKLSKDKKSISIELDRLRITHRLRKLGYYRYDRSDGSITFVYMQENRIKIIDNEQKIIDAFENYVLSLPDRTVVAHTEDNNGNVTDIEHTITSWQIQEQLYKNLSTWFSTLARLRPDKPIEIIKDEESCKYFYFTNTAVKVSNAGITEIDYRDIQGCIWESGVHDRVFNYTTNKGDFELFFENICNRDIERKEAAMTLMGYLMHDYYDNNLAAVMLTDVNKDTTGKAAGGTGKGLIGKALGQMLNKDDISTKYVCISGKNFTREDDGKCYSAADISTQLIHLEDLKKSFDLECLYNDITDGCTMRKLHHDPVRRRVKFLLSMNSTLYDIDGSSTRRRLYIFELSNYYNEKHRPSDEFRWFFGNEWTDKDWNEFYSFMLRCQLAYFQKGVIVPKDVNYYTRSLKESLPEDFYYWFEDYISPFVKAETNVRLKKKDDLFMSYTKKYPIPDDEKNRKRFTNWCKRYLDRMSIPYKEVRSTVDYIVLYPTSND